MRAWLFSIGYGVAWFFVRLLPIDSVQAAAVVDLAVVLILAATWWSFDRDDPPRLAWGLLAGAMALNAIGIAMRDQPWAAAWSRYWMHPYVLVNVLLAVSIWRFWTTAQGSGLAPKWSRGAKAVVGVVAVLAGGVAVALLVDVVTTWRAAAVPRTPEDLGVFLMSASSALADACVVVGAAMLARTFLPMAAGSLARPYLLLSVSGFAYLLLDGITVAFAGAQMPAMWIDRGQWVYSVGEAAMVAAALTQLEMTGRARWRARMLT